MDEAPQPTEIEEPRTLRFLRRLVTILTAVMIGGVLLIVLLLAVRLQTPGPAWPPELALPPGVDVLSISAGPGWYAVITAEARLLIFDSAGDLRSDDPISLP
ncbi:MAG: DUF6476 family protein [Pseudomonadota bacterium]